MLAFMPGAPLSFRGGNSALTPRTGSVSPRLASGMAPMTRVRMVLSEKETGKETRPVRITGNNITITEALRSHINDKLGKIAKRFSGIISKMDVHLTVEHNPSVPNRHKAEVIAFAGKTILRTEVRSDDMYAAVDSVEERIGRTIRKYKERKEAKSKSKGAGGVNGAGSAIAPLSDDEEDEQEDPFTDVYQNVSPGIPKVNGVVRRKVFPMPLQTIEEAVLCCEYVDHPWYLFRNAATGEISLVYKRNHGGYGLIEPSNLEAVDEEEV